VLCCWFSVWAPWFGRGHFYAKKMRKRRLFQALIRLQPLLSHHRNALWVNIYLSWLRSLPFRCFWADSPRTTQWKGKHFMALTFHNGFPIRWCAPGIFKQPCSGSPRVFLRLVCSSHPLLTVVKILSIKNLG